jgi:hypothetical protein
MDIDENIAVDDSTNDAETEWEEQHDQESYFIWEDTLNISKFAPTMSRNYIRKIYETEKTKQIIDLTHTSELSSFRSSYCSPKNILYSSYCMTIVLSYYADLFRCYLLMTSLSKPTRASWCLHLPTFLSQIPFRPLLSSTLTPLAFNSLLATSPRLLLYFQVKKLLVYGGIELLQLEGVLRGMGEEVRGMVKVGRWEVRGGGWERLKRWAEGLERSGVEVGEFVGEAVGREGWITRQVVGEEEENTILPLAGVEKVIKFKGIENIRERLEKQKKIWDDNDFTMEFVSKQKYEIARFSDLNNRQEDIVEARNCVWILIENQEAFTLEWEIIKIKQNSKDQTEVKYYEECGCKLDTNEMLVNYEQFTQETKESQRTTLISTEFTYVSLNPTYIKLTNPVLVSSCLELPEKLQKLKNSYNLILWVPLSTLVEYQPYIPPHKAKYKYVTRYLEGDPSIRLIRTSHLYPFSQWFYILKVEYPIDDRFDEIFRDLRHVDIFEVHILSSCQEKDSDLNKYQKRHKKLRIFPNMHRVKFHTPIEAEVGAITFRW